MRRGLPTAVLASAVVGVAAFATPAFADVNFDINGKIYGKYMYQNDNTQGCLSLSNPFWVDNIGGHNGVCTEFALMMKAQVGPKVSAGVRLQTRWGQLWQDWWENGDLKPGIIDTSGESLGMNHAAYVQLRSAWLRIGPPIPTVSWVTIGSTDYSMWNEWTIGKARYIDRENGQGIFVEGKILPNGLLNYTTGAMALPKLWAGPGWNTGLSANEPLAYLYGTDWAYAAKLESRVNSDLRFRAIGTLIKDYEADRYSPFLTGAPDAARGADHNVALATRFSGVNGTVDGAWTPSFADWLSVTGLVAGSSNYVNPDYATNLVRNGQGFSPVVFKTDDKGNPIASQGLAGTLRVEMDNPFHNGLSMKFEYFNIGSEYNAVMGARREADVLLTEGVITGGFIRGGQLPTLNIANEFVDWDEPWYESAIGWTGGTALFEYVNGGFKASLEATHIGYNTNMQNRDVKNQYPDFLYTHGFTDPYAFTADQDYANVYDRGRDPRSVYADYQDRRTEVAILNAEYAIPNLRGAVINFKGKYVYDRDNRMLSNDGDNYVGSEYLGFLSFTLQPTNELRTSIGYEYTYWDEKNRNGTEQSGFYDAATRRHVARIGATYAFGGALLGYTMEYFHKDLMRDSRAYYNERWDVLRAKATFEVSF